MTSWHRVLDADELPEGPVTTPAIVVDGIQLRDRVWLTVEL